MEHREHSRRGNNWLGVGCLLFIVLGFGGFYGVLGFMGSGSTYPETRAFDAAEWQSDTMKAYSQLDRGAYPRLGMIDDLLERYSFEGMSRSEVIALLGEPREWEGYSSYDLAYFLGPEPMGIDFNSLAFRLDSTGVVTEARIVED